jgi:hypothetical protein
MSTTQTVMQVPPELLLADDNARFGLKKFRVESLASSITEVGRIMEPLKVTVLAEPGPGGEKYRIRDGHYRQAAALKLNADGAGITCPVLVEEEGAEGLDRVKLQVVVNMERNDLSPMDAAIAIQKLLNLDVPKVEIRKLFSRPGGRKGQTMAPISNSLLNMYVSFLEFPKSIQNKIHDGTLGVAAAYELAKYAKDNGLDLKDPQVQKVLDRAEADRLKAIEFEEKEEEKFLESEKKAEEQELKAKKEAEVLEASQKLAEKAAADLKARVDVAAEAYKKLSSTPKSDKEVRKAAEEAFKAAEESRKIAEKAAAETEASLKKLQEKAKKNEELAEERRKKLEEARAKSAKSSNVKPSDVKNAATKESGGVVALKPSEIKEAVHSLTLPGSYPKVQKIGLALEKCFAGTITDQQLLSEISWITGERKEKPKHIKEGK